MHFGEWRERPDRRGGTRIVGEWALHIQCDWRFSNPGHPVLSPADYHIAPDGRRISAGWDIVGANRFDAISKALHSDFETARPSVRTVDFGTAGRFSMDLGGGRHLVVIPADNCPDEAWRLFQPGTDNEHIVMPPE
jgi:hypothetical protein